MPAIYQLTIPKILGKRQPSQIPKLQISTPPPDPQKSFAPPCHFKIQVPPSLGILKTQAFLEEDTCHQISFYDIINLKNSKSFGQQWYILYWQAHGKKLQNNLLAKQMHSYPHYPPH